MSSECVGRHVWTTMCERNNKPTVVQSCCCDLVELQSTQRGFHSDGVCRHIHGPNSPEQGAWGPGKGGVSQDYSHGSSSLML